MASDGTTPAPSSRFDGARPGPATADELDVDVAIVGAGISGIGAAYHLQRDCPGKRYAILEAREAIGGTWDLFRYPGIRSDSDMFTLGYGFKPWTHPQAIADGASIRDYVEEAAREHDIERHIRFGERLRSAEWSSEQQCWTLELERAGSGERSQLRARFLSMCSGYYRYDRGHTPDFPGAERFTGTVIHPQHWPEDLDYGDRRIVVIGSGATAVTLIPELAERAQHVVMLQRSPTYMVSAPGTHPIANVLRRLLGMRIAYHVIRWLSARLQQFAYRSARKDPAGARKRLLQDVRKQLGPGFDVDRHFAPRYDPWEQRLCLVPDGDFFEAIRAGKASVVTDQIEGFTERGIRLRSGDELAADIVVTATGLDLEVLGGVRFAVDGEPVDFARTYTYKGMMFSGVPNLSITFGYINASWTLRADLTAEYVCRLINHMDETGTCTCVPRLREQDRDMPERPWIEGFTPGYMTRSMHLFPRQGAREPWLNPQSYHRDRKMLRRDPIEDGVLIFGPP